MAIQDSISIAIKGDLNLGGTPPSSDWILKTGFWDDLGIWVDTDVWID